MVSTERRRAAVAYLMKRHKISQRKACRLVEQNRSTQRYRPGAPEEEQRLIRAMNELAGKHPQLLVEFAQGKRTIVASFP